MWFYFAVVILSIVSGFEVARDSNYPKARPFWFVAGFFPFIGIVVSIHLGVILTDRLYPNDLGLAPWVIMAVAFCCPSLIAVALFTIAENKQKQERHKRWARAYKIKREHDLEIERQREAVRQDLIRAKDDPAFIAYVFEE